MSPTKSLSWWLNGIFSPGNPFSVRLHESRPVLDERRNFEDVPGATVTLMDGQGNELTELEYQGYGLYQSNLHPQPGKSYSIKVSKPGYKTATATSKVPQDTGMMKNYEVTRSDESTLDLTIKIDDSVGKDYYEIYAQEKVVIEESDSTRIFEHKLTLNPDDTVLDDLGERSRFHLFVDDVLFNDQKVEISFSMLMGHYPQCQDASCTKEKEFKLFNRRIGEEYFKYRQTSALQGQLSENPFAEPVPVYDNVKNGLGIFAGFRVSEYSIEFPGY